MIVFKIIFIIIGIILIFRAVIKEDFDELYIGMLILAIGLGLQQVE
jgi:fucose permease